MSDEEKKQEPVQKDGKTLNENRELPQSDDLIPMPDVKPPKDEDQSDTGSDGNDE